ncbi:hypothetical protein ACFL5O_12245, partial [Myxococcota bacterium]
HTPGLVSAGRGGSATGVPLGGTGGRTIEAVAGNAAGGVPSVGHGGWVSQVAGGNATGGARSLGTGGSISGAGGGPSGAGGSGSTVEPVAGGLGLGSEIHINSRVPHDQEQVQVAVGPGGQSVAVWLSDSQAAAGSSELFGQLLDATGMKVGGEFQISHIAASSSHDRSHFDVAMASDGSFVVAWSEYAGTDAVYAQRYSASGAPLGSRITVNNDTDAWTEYEVSVARQAGGAFAVLFDWEAGFTVGSRLQAYSADGTPLTDQPEWVSDQSRTYRLDLAALTGGGYVSCWRYHDMDTEIFCRLAGSDGVALGSEIHINSTTAGVQDHPRVAALSHGGFVVAWMSEGTHGDFIGARVFDSSGSAASGELVASGPTSEYPEEPAVAASESHFLVVWNGWENGGYSDEIWGRVFGTDGTSASEVLQVNTSTVGGQTAVQAFSASSGRALVAWQDSAREGETFTTADSPGLGIYGQLVQLPSSH